MTLCPPTSLSRRERERNARREAILHSALEVFAAAGYAGATIDEIASRAEFGKGTVYNYFEDKRELLLAVLDLAAEGFREHVREQLSQSAAADLPTRAFFHAFIESTLSYFLERTEIFRLLFKESGRLLLEGDPQILAFTHDHERRMIAMLSEYVARAVESGSMRAYPPAAISHLLMGNIHGYLHYAIMVPGECSNGPVIAGKDAADFITTALFDGLMSDAGKATSPARKS